MTRLRALGDWLADMAWTLAGLIDGWWARHA